MKFYAATAETCEKLDALIALEDTLMRHGMYRTVVDEVLRQPEFRVRETSLPNTIVHNGKKWCEYYLPAATVDAVPCFAKTNTPGVYEVWWVMELRGYGNKWRTTACASWPAFKSWLERQLPTIKAARHE